MLRKNGIVTVHLGKIADIVVNPYGKSISCVDSTEVLDLTIQAIQDYRLGFLCTNVQETDLAGHSMNTQFLSSKKGSLLMFHKQMLHSMTEYGRCRREGF